MHILCMRGFPINSLTHSVWNALSSYFSFIAFIEHVILHTNTKSHWFVGFCKEFSPGHIQCFCFIVLCFGKDCLFTCLRQNLTIFCKWLESMVFCPQLSFTIKLYHCYMLSVFISMSSNRWQWVTFAVLEVIFSSLLGFLTTC